LTGRQKSGKFDGAVLLPTEQIAFGPFEVDMSTGRLLRDGVDLRLRPRAVHALHALVQNSGRCVEYERLIKNAWEGAFVSHHTVDETMREVKKALSEYGSWVVRHRKQGYCLEMPASDNLVKEGWHLWTRRTREGFEKALACFEQAALHNSADFRAFEGIAYSYQMLATYSMRPPREMYRGFLAAHGRAVALCGMTPELRSHRAHGMHLFERKLEEAEAEFHRVLREKPTLATTYVQLSILYATMGRLDEAWDVLVQGRKVNPLWTLLPATEVFIRLCRREFESAAEYGRKAVDLYPYLQLGRAFFAQALEFSGRVEEALAEYRFAGAMSPDLPWLKALEATCLAKNDRAGEALKILQELHQIRATTYVDAYYMALLLDALGNRDAAFRELERAVEENSTMLYILDVDPKLDALRADPRFLPLRERLFTTNPYGAAATEV
jgi:DNA-binding winged helix-turn-helix (wHTH) protein/Flp pilus assembly protein TadD